MAPKSKKLKTDQGFSKNLMGLKFMQRAAKKEDNKEEFIIYASYQACEQLRFGRLSFKGMNTEIEDIMERARTAG